MAFVVGNDHLLAVEALQHFTVHETDALHGANTVISANTCVFFCRTRSNSLSCENNLTWKYCIIVFYRSVAVNEHNSYGALKLV